MRGVQQSFLAMDPESRRWGTETRVQRTDSGSVEKGRKETACQGRKGASRERGLQDTGEGVTHRGCQRMRIMSVAVFPPLLGY